ncbi:hypothetical protein ACLGGT_07075 [Roseovarius sp. MS2]|uniref:hypothetical protein n=1 Tax=Roseovarius sp. MS2 TaxID=3390728 RepID=UPI003EDC1469
MKNSTALAAFLTAADKTHDMLDATACRRAAVWLRWSDAFGATLTEDESIRISQGGALGDCARQLIRRLSDEFPAPPEDGNLRYLDDDETTAWMQNILTGPDRKKTAAADDPGKVESPFADIAPGY